MSEYLYLSLIPESLVASMLPAAEFGVYLATGTRKRPHGQAMFFQVKPSFTSEYFDLATAAERCVPHESGEPKHSVYLGIYRVLEHVPLEALGNLYLVTAHGQVLEIQPKELPADFGAGRYHLYQEMAPVHPLVATVHAPGAFGRFITDPKSSVHVPRICFVEVDLGGLAEDPAEGDVTGLPYPNLRHIRSCLGELEPLGAKQTKTVDRVGLQQLIYRSVSTGFYVGDQGGVLYYPYPTREELEDKYYTWWRCANDNELEQFTLA